MFSPLRSYYSTPCGLILFKVYMGQFCRLTQPRTLMPPVQGTSSHFSPVSASCEHCTAFLGRRARGCWHSCSRVPGIAEFLEVARVLLTELSALNAGLIAPPCHSFFTFCFHSYLLHPLGNTSHSAKKYLSSATTTHTNTSSHLRTNRVGSVGLGESAPSLAGLFWRQGKVLWC